MRLYNGRSLQRASTSIPGLGSPITSIDVTYDGKWVLATSDKYLMLVRTTYTDDKVRSVGRGMMVGVADVGAHHLHRQQGMEKGWVPVWAPGWRNACARGRCSGKTACACCKAMLHLAQAPPAATNQLPLRITKAGMSYKSVQAETKNGFV